MSHQPPPDGERATLRAKKRAGNAEEHPAARAADDQEQRLLNRSDEEQGVAQQDASAQPGHHAPPDTEHRKTQQPNRGKRRAQERDQRHDHLATRRPEQRETELKGKHAVPVAERHQLLPAEEHDPGGSCGEDPPPSPPPEQPVEDHRAREAERRVLGLHGDPAEQTSADHDRPRPASFATQVEAHGAEAEGQGWDVLHVVQAREEGGREERERDERPLEPAREAPHEAVQREGEEGREGEQG